MLTLNAVEIFMEILNSICRRDFTIFPLGCPSSYVSWVISPPGVCGRRAFPMGLMNSVGGGSNGSKQGREYASQCGKRPRQQATWEVMSSPSLKGFK